MKTIVTTCVLCAIIGYATLVPCKIAGLLPPHFTWLTIAVGPMVFIGMALMSMAESSIRERSQRSMVYGAIWSIYLAALVLAILSQLRLG